MGLLDVPPTAGADLPPLRQRLTGARAFFVPLVLFVIGVSSLGVGVSSVVHAGQLARNGVRVKSVVLSDEGTSIEVGYTTASGQHERGTLPAPSLASHRIGYSLTVVYDPSDPSIVTAPGETSSDLGNPFNPWNDVVEGIAELLVALAIVIWLVIARKRRSPVRSAGDALDKP